MITFYEPAKKNGVLANFYHTAFSIQPSQRMVSLEHIYQASKFVNRRRIAYSILNTRTAAQAKALSRKHKDLRYRQWQQVKVPIMAYLIWLRIRCDLNFARSLGKTGVQEIVEWAPDDLFWGYSDRGGKNMMGKILMRARSNLRDCSIRQRPLNCAMHTTLLDRLYIRRTKQWLHHIIETPQLESLPR